jgi:uncharacterized protein (TIGR03437 family)
MSGRGFLVLVLMASGACGQPAPVSCLVSSSSPVLRAESLAEPLGEIVLNCVAPAGAAVETNLSVFLPAPVTNKKLSDGSADAVLTIHGTPAGVPARVQSVSSVAWNGLKLTVPPGGNAVLRIRNIRVAMNTLPLFAPVSAVLTFSGSAAVQLDRTAVTVGLVQRSAYATTTSAQVSGLSRLPSGPLTVDRLLAAGTRYHSTRVTEGFPEAFQRKDAGADQGTRFLVRYSGLPAGARLLAPDYVAGSNATKPTAGGDLGFEPSGGVYTIGSGALLLARVRDAQSDGSGGSALSVPPVMGFAPWQLESLSEIPLSGGSGYLVYEVIESNPAAQESVQWPVFLLLDRPPSGPSAPSVELRLAPVSADSGFSGAPAPRFWAVDLPSDCPVLNDCHAAYMPLTAIAGPALEFRALEGAAFQDSYFWVQNARGGVLNWSASVRYRSGADWLSLDPPYGLNETYVHVRVFPAKLSPGTYEATVTVDGGPVAGSKEIPVRLVVVGLPPPDPSPVIRSVVNAASFSASEVVAGSLATVFADKVTGGTVALSFDGIPALVTSVTEGQVNAVIPAALAGKAQATAVLTVGNLSSAPFSAPLAAAAPAIFANGILNQDNQLNGPSAPAAAGSAIQVFLTGIPAEALVTAKVHDWDNQQPLYAGPAPGIPGLQQVNLRIPPGLPTMQTEVVVCATVPAAAGRVCSKPAKLYLKSID